MPRHGPEQKEVYPSRHCARGRGEDKDLHAAASKEWIQRVVVWISLTSMDVVVPVLDRSEVDRCVGHSPVVPIRGLLPKPDVIMSSWNTTFYL